MILGLFRKLLKGRGKKEKKGGKGENREVKDFVVKISKGTQNGNGKVFKIDGTIF